MKDNIHKELAELAPTLAAMEKRNPFKVPDGYFSELEENTILSISEKPITSAVPEGYFDSLADRVLDQVTEKPKTKVVPLYRKSWLSIAASLIFLIVAVLVIQMNTAKVDLGEEFVFDFETEEALDYLIENDELYLSDLITFDVYEEDFEEDASNIDMMEDQELEDFLNELDPEDLEDLL